MQPRLKINLLKISTTEGHQILQQITKLKYSNHKTKSHNQHFVLYLPSPTHGSNINFAGLKDHPTVLKSPLSPGLQTSSAPKTRLNTSKIQHHTGAESRRTEIKQHGASRLISFSFPLQKDTRTWNQVWKSLYNKKNHPNTSRVYSILCKP